MSRGVESALEKYWKCREQWIVTCHSLSEPALSSGPHTHGEQKPMFSLNSWFVPKQMGEFLGNTGHGSLFLSLCMSVSASRDSPLGSENG